MPELSFGTHFFQDLVEADIFYVAVFSDKQETIFNPSTVSSMPKHLKQLLPEGEIFEDILKVYEVTDRNFQIVGDIVSQKLICYFT